MKAIELYRNDDHIILVAAIAFKDLKDIVKFTQRKSSNWSGELDEEVTKFYQRQTNEIRVRNIKNYINDTLFSDSKGHEVLFPSSMILSMSSGMNDFDDVVENIIDFNLPKEKDSCLIVDGQHRMKAMFSLYEELKSSLFGTDKLEKVLNYKFNCTVLIDYDIWEQAKIFASVNFNQKPVDRSLYFDIFGEIPKVGRDEKFSDLYVAHELGKYLNSSDKSPLYGFVKNFNSKSGFVSQAFLTQAILGLLGTRSVWNVIVEDFKSTNDKKDLHRKLPKVFVAYFSTIKTIFHEYWPKSTDRNSATILTKTNSLGALIKLLGRINTMFNLGLFPNYNKKDLLELSLSELQELFEDIFKSFDNKTETGRNLANSFFGEDSKYRGGGSLGLQSQLYRELASAIGIPIHNR